MLVVAPLPFTHNRVLPTPLRPTATPLPHHLLLPVTYLPLTQVHLLLGWISPLPHSTACLCRAHARTAPLLVWRTRDLLSFAPWFGRTAGATREERCTRTKLYLLLYTTLPYHARTLNIALAPTFPSLPVSALYSIRRGIAVVLTALGGRGVLTYQLDYDVPSTRHHATPTILHLVPQLPYRTRLWAFAGTAAFAGFAVGFARHAADILPPTYLYSPFRTAGRFLLAFLFGWLRSLTSTLLVRHAACLPHHPALPLLQFDRHG